MQRLVQFAEARVLQVNALQEGLHKVFHFSLGWPNILRGHQSFVFVVLSLRLLFAPALGLGLAFGLGFALAPALVHRPSGPQLVMDLEQRGVCLRRGEPGELSDEPDSKLLLCARHGQRHLLEHLAQLAQRDVDQGTVLIKRTKRDVIGVWRQLWALFYLAQLCCQLCGRLFLHCSRVFLLVRSLPGLVRTFISLPVLCSCPGAFCGWLCGLGLRSGRSICVLLRCELALVRGRPGRQLLAARLGLGGGRCGLRSACVLGSLRLTCLCKRGHFQEVRHLAANLKLVQRTLKSFDLGQCPCHGNPLLDCLDDALRGLQSGLLLRSSCFCSCCGGNRVKSRRLLRYDGLCVSLCLRCGSTRPRRAVPSSLGRARGAAGLGRGLKRLGFQSVVLAHVCVHAGRLELLHFGDNLRRVLARTLRNPASPVNKPPVHPLVLRVDKLLGNTKQISRRDVGSHITLDARPSKDSHLLVGDNLALPHRNIGPSASWSSASPTASAPAAASAPACDSSSRRLLQPWCREVVK
mmetsp:Transcript_88167/g.249821  ORF Transcript_88167/g.249821 Transcript_88167/m.249821 type:complete len:522 (+) Transcript_88167:1175-2740(+)